MLLDNVDDDFKFYTDERGRYERIMERMEEYRQQQLKLHMGSEFEKDPLLTKQELLLAIVNRKARFDRLIELRAPDIILETEKRLLGELRMQLSSSDYISSRVQKEYRKKYDKRRNAFRCEMDWKDFDDIAEAA